MRRGEVFWVKLSPRSGSEQRGSRPYVVMSPNAMNDNPRWNSFVILPLTTRSKLRSPTIVSFQQGVAGLPEDSSVLCHQITTVDRSKFGEYIGAFQPSELESIEQGLLAALGIL